MRWICDSWHFANLQNLGNSHFDGIFRIPWDLLKSLEISWDPLRSLEIPWDLLRSLEIPWVLLRSLEISWDSLRSLEIPWDLLRSLVLETSWDPLRSEVNNVENVDTVDKVGTVMRQSEAISGYDLQNCIQIGCICVCITIYALKKLMCGLENLFIGDQVPSAHSIVTFKFSQTLK